MNRVLAVLFMCLAAVAVGKFILTTAPGPSLLMSHTGRLPTGETYIIDQPIGVDVDGEQCIGIRGIPFGILICKDEDRELWAVHQKTIDDEVRSARR